ncbi:Gfo/Idh/MocA family oxidoreductase [Paenibacillus doosanensis]|uniref:Glucose--fructose oxidoreductase n=1 Tax=Paenibacillus konkukensis TaxID=2020716 RepID=A0ABY4RZ94_9BACL|nr:MULTISPECIES: Gfo/Idh/MocA family oxidoreductase [Paenibacillus]MCS7463336.1 Gfo/Idh/MocA family oxidoreductase [Paenibacillus doosanensis]UQZ87642.1 Glucose--fructose oxidoreductase precursor [Paenibacillus konkukensis]
MKPIRLGMIGSGHVSSRYFEQAALIEGVSFVATYSRHLTNAENKAAAYGIPRWYDDYRVMMDKEELDAVIVTTPHSLHAEPVLAALERGLHVLNEKPMATTFEDCQRMVSLAEAHNAIFMSLPFDLNPALLAASEYVNERYIGKITGAEAQLSLPGPWRDNWYYNKSIAHGGAVLDCLVYPVSRLVALLGPAVSVMAEVNTLIPNRIVGDGKRVQSDVDDNVTLIVQFAGGQHAVIRVLWGMSFKQNNTIIYGRNGTLALNDSGYPFVIQTLGQPVPEAERVVWRGLEHCYVPHEKINRYPHESVIAHFVRCLRNGEQPVQSGRQQLHVHEIMFAAYRSAESGQRYSLTTTFTPWSKLDTGIFDTRSDYI